MPGIQSDEAELELHGNLGRELEGDVLVGVSAAVASGSRNQADSTRRFDPSLGLEDEAIQTGQHSNPVEFDGIKTKCAAFFRIPT
jgi:hypothetical protein